MSNLGEFELEDIVWEFGDNDDHIVPHPGEKKSGCVVERDSFKRPRTELNCAESDADSGHTATNVIGRKKDNNFKAVKQGKQTMLEKRPWPRSSDGNLLALLDNDSNRNSSCSTSDETWTSKACLRSSNMKAVASEFCSNDSFLGDQTDVHHRLNNDGHTESNLTFFGTGLEEKDSADLLFYEWPDLENFEDVDNIFRSCDSTFGLELDENDDMSWFSSSHAIGGTDDALKSSFDFSGGDRCGQNTLKEEEIYRLSNRDMVATESVEKLTPVSCKTDLQNCIASVPSSVMDSYANESAAIPHGDALSQCQMHSYVTPSKHQKSSKEKGTDQPLGDGVSYIKFDKLNDTGDANHLLNAQHSFLPANGRQQEISHQTGLQMPMPVRKTSNSYSSSHVPPSSKPSIMNSEGDGLSSITLRDSSRVSDQMQSVESSHDVSVRNPTYSGNKRKDRHYQRRLARHDEKNNLKVQRADSIPNYVKKQISCSENEAEGQSEVDGNDVSAPGELDTCTIQESSCVSSVLDEISVDASSLQQLQHVMEQLDISTKLCIRDSLYRLARSAEQRHKCFNQTSGRADGKNSNEAMLDGTNKCAGFMDMETDTNPIDRSIAHLLFHRPSDHSAAAPALDAVALKSHTMVPTPNHGPLMSDKQACAEETPSTNEQQAEPLKCDSICAN